MAFETLAENIRNEVDCFKAYSGLDAGLQMINREFIWHDRHPLVPPMLKRQKSKKGKPYASLKAIKPVALPQLPQQPPRPFPYLLGLSIPVGVGIGLLILACSPDGLWHSQPAKPASNTTTQHTPDAATIFLPTTSATDMLLSTLTQHIPEWINQSAPLLEDIQPLIPPQPTPEEESVVTQKTVSPVIEHTAPSPHAVTHPTRTPEIAHPPVHKLVVHADVTLPPAVQVKQPFKFHHAKGAHTKAPIQSLTPQPHQKAHATAPKVTKPVVVIEDIQAPAQIQHKTTPAKSPARPMHKQPVKAVKHVIKVTSAPQPELTQPASIRLDVPISPTLHSNSPQTFQHDTFERFTQAQQALKTSHHPLKTVRPQLLSAMENHPASLKPAEQSPAVDSHIFTTELATVYTVPQTGAHMPSQKALGEQKTRTILSTIPKQIYISPAGLTYDNGQTAMPKPVELHPAMLAKANHSIMEVHSLQPQGAYLDVIPVMHKPDESLLKAPIQQARPVDYERISLEAVEITKTRLQPATAPKDTPHALMMLAVDAEPHTTPNLKPINAEERLSGSSWLYLHHGGIKIKKPTTLHPVKGLTDY